MLRRRMRHAAIMHGRTRPASPGLHQGQNADVPISGYAQHGWLRQITPTKKHETCRPARTVLPARALLLATGSSAGLIDEAIVRVWSARRSCTPCPADLAFTPYRLHVSEGPPKQMGVRALVRKSAWGRRCVIVLELQRLPNRARLTHRRLGTCLAGRCCCPAGH